MSVIISGNVRGATVVSGGGTVVIDGKVYQGTPGSVTVIQGEPLPEVDVTFDSIRSVEIDGDDVTLEKGEVFHAVGQGFCKRVGERVIVSNFTGTITMPPAYLVSVKVNSGNVRGTCQATELDLKANSGDIVLNLTKDAPLPSITAKANSGRIVINVH